VDRLRQIKAMHNSAGSNRADVVKAWRDGGGHMTGDIIPPDGGPHFTA
jgi:hypothetical protein